MADFFQKSEEIYIIRANLSSSKHRFNFLME